MPTLKNEAKNKDIIYSDYPIVKETTYNGEVKTYQNSEALAQSLKVWLVMARGEKVRSLAGGYLIPFIGKPLDDEHAQLMASRILTGLTEDFQPPITVMDLQVIPDVQNLRWVVSVKGYNADLNIGVNTVVVVNNNL